MVKLHRVLIAAVVRGLSEVLLQKKQADTTVEQLLGSNKNWGARDRHFIADNIYSIIRYKRFYEYCAGNEVTDEASLWLLTGVKLGMEGGELNRITEFTNIDLKAVAERAEKAKGIRKIRESVPDWLDALGEKELGTAWEEELHALNSKATFSIRVNTLKTNKRVVTSLLENEGIEFSEVETAPDALIIHSKKNFHHFPAYKNGLFEVQDVSSQLVAPLLEAQPGMLVIDGCAGAGGKTLHIAALMENKGEILAVDVNEKKLEQLPVRAKRAGANIIEPFAAELLTTGTQTKLRNAVDRILLDVPCSGTGVLRRKPDAKWSLSLAFIKELVERQAEILDKYAPMLKPGGILVYSTCSILPAENEKQVQAFIKRQEGKFELLEEKRVSPAQTGFDGFYMAKLKKLA
jgi:16S rRNA (cytosine967-C5)-methyltransferase